MSENNEKQYFDLHTKGIGYLGRARTVEVKRGTPFLAVGVTAIHGPADDVQKVYFDCRVNGTEAQKLVSQYMDRINDRNAKVLVGFTLGDLYTDPFVYEKGEKKGQPGAGLKARLLRLSFIKIDGEAVYKADAGEQGEPADAPQTPAAEAAPASDLPAEVSLSKDDPDFQARKAELKEKGYKFDGQTKTWKLPAAA